MSRFGHSNTPAPASPPAPPAAPAQHEKVKIDTGLLRPGELLYMVLLDHVQDAPLDLRMELAGVLNDGVEFATMGRPLRKLFAAAEDQLFDEEDDEDEDDDEDDEDEDDEDR